MNLELPNALPTGWSGPVFYLIQETDNNFGKIGATYDHAAISIVADDAANYGSLDSATHIWLSSDTNKILYWIPGIDGA